MNTTKPSAGAMRAAQALLRYEGASIPGDIIEARIRWAEIIDRESGLQELLKAMEILDETLNQGQPGMPVLPNEWRQWLLPFVKRAIAKASNPNADVKQVFEKGRWT